MACLPDEHPVTERPDGIDEVAHSVMSGARGQVCARREIVELATPGRPQ